MSKCVSCGIETRREWLGTFARRAPRVAGRLRTTAVASMISALVVGSLWHIERTSSPPVDSIATGWIAAATIAISALAFAGFAVVFVIGAYARRVVGKPMAHIVLPRETPGSPAVEPVSGSAYRSASPRVPVAPPPLCTRHEALARQNQPRN